MSPKFYEMPSNSLHQTKGILLFAVFLISLLKLPAQCDPPNEIPSNVCESAPLTCLLNACYSTSTSFPPTVFNWCGAATVLDNPQYFLFIATSTTVEIHVHVDYCYSGNGLQAAILGACPWTLADVIDCDPHEGMGGTMILVANGLNIGDIYWLVIDGSNGAMCQYTVTFAEGIFEPQIDEEIQSGSAQPSSVCQGFNSLYMYAEPAITNAHGYAWTLGWNNQTVTTTLPELILDIHENEPTGTYDVCVVGFSGCDTTDIPYCFDVTIFEIEDEVKDPASFCPEEFPFNWHNVIISGPGFYQKRFTTPDGCAFDSTWMVSSFPEVPIGELNIVHCFNDSFDPFIYQGEVYDQSGTYKIHHPGMGSNGCDSSTQLNLTLRGTELFIENTCSEGLAILSPYILELSPANANLTYEWYDCGLAGLLSSEELFEMDSSGCYCVIIYNGVCADTICSSYTIDVCNSFCNLAIGTACVNERVLFSYTDTSFIEPSYHWLIEGPDMIRKYYSGNDSLWLEFENEGCYSVSLTIVDSSNSFTCIDTICIDSPQSTASICCEAIICEPCTTIEFTLTGTAPWTIIILKDTIPDTISGILTSPYFHPVCLIQGQEVYFTLLQVTDSGNSCQGQIIGTNSIAIIFPTQPIFSITIQDSILCVSGGLTYSWYECDSTTVLATTECFRPLTSGCYCVDVIDIIGCNHTLCTDVIVNTDYTDNNSGIILFPNPAHEYIYGTFSKETVLPATWVLYDLLGNKQQSGIVDDFDFKINFEKELPAGLYFIKFETSNKQTQLFKLVID